MNVAAHRRPSECVLVHADELVSNVVRRSVSTVALSNHDTLPTRWHYGSALVDCSTTNSSLLFRGTASSRPNSSFSLTRYYFGHFSCCWWLERSLLEVVAQYGIVVVMTHA